MYMEFKTSNGKKTEHGIDKILHVKTEGWETIKNEDILNIINHIFMNEERIYPKRKGFSGSNMFFEEILKLKINNEND